METVSPVKRPAKRRPAPERRVRWIQRPDRQFDDWGAVEITVGKQMDMYLIRRVSTDYGLAGFTLSKVDAAKMSETGDVYHVLLHGRQSRCDCRGHEAHGHCKHLAAVEALLRATPFDDTVPVPEPRPAASEVAKAQREAPQWWHVRAEQRQDGTWCIAAAYHFDATQRFEAATADELLAQVRQAEAERESKRQAAATKPLGEWWLTPITRMSDGSEMIHVRYGDRGGAARLHRPLGIAEWKVMVGWGPESKTIGLVTDPADAVRLYADRFMAYLPRGGRESNYTGD